ncbi:hypothetical protein ACVXHA_00665 [Escherichia coli]
MPYRDQSDIYNYDCLCCNLTTLACSGTGLTRSYCIASANQVMTGVTSHSMMMLPLNVLIFPLVKLTISRSLALAMT